MKNHFEVIKLSVAYNIVYKFYGNCNKDGVTVAIKINVSKELL